MQQKTLALSISVLDVAPHRSLNELFSFVQAQRGALLFDSSHSTLSESRFSIMLWNPDKIVEARDGYVMVKDRHSGFVKASHQGPLDTVNIEFELLKKQITQVIDPQKVYNDLPFVVGVAGFCGYELGRYYESIPSMAIHDTKTSDMVIGIYTNALIEDQKTGQIYEVRLTNQASFGETYGHDLPEAQPFKLDSKWQSNQSKSQYIENIRKIKQYLTAGDCYQVNYSQRFSAEFSGSEWTAYQQLRAANSAPFSAFMRTDTSAIISISPERFLRVKRNKVQTKPIKGTRPRYDEPLKDEASAASLLSAEKDRAENLMIVDLLRNDLSKHCKPSSVEVPALFALESYNAVHHLVSTVTGDLEENSSVFDLFTGAFPGGSITGAPKIRAMEIIDELEPHRRNIYCGSMVYVGIKDDMDSSICIRTLLAEDNVIHCWAGGGIVLDSNATDEYQETLDKVSKILPILETKE